jgi:hypothetical protein
MWKVDRVPQSAQRGDCRYECNCDAFNEVSRTVAASAFRLHGQAMRPGPVQWAIENA